VYRKKLYTPVNNMPVTKKITNKISWSSLCVLIVSTLVFVGFVYLTFCNRNMTWKQTWGEVIRQEPDPYVGVNYTRYYAIVRYAINGRQYEVRSDSATYPAPKLYSSRRVAYDPTNPANAKVKYTKSETIIIYVVGFVSACIAIASLRELVVSFKHRQKN
jgi:hypothetical protein